MTPDIERRWIAPSIRSREQIDAIIAAPILAPQHTWRWWLTLAVVAVDQLSKAVVNWKLAVFDSVTIIPGLIDLTHVQNKGVAFGLLNDAP